MSLFRRGLVAIATSLMIGNLTFGAVQAQTITIAIDPGSAESNLFWETVGGLILPNLQTLVGNDPQTGSYDNSALAESWQHNDDFTS